MSEFVQEKMGKKIINGIEPFQKFFFNSCFFSSLFSILEYYKCSIIPFLTNGIGAYMFYDSLDRCSSYIKFYQVHPPEEILSKVGLKFDGKEICENLIKDIVSSIDLGRPVIIAVNCYYESIRPELYQKENLPHYLLIYGYSMEEQIFYITEQNNIDDIKYEKKIISMDDTLEAYEGFIKVYMKKGVQTFWSFYKSSTLVENHEDSQLLVYKNNLLEYKSYIYQGQVEQQKFYERFCIIANNENEMEKYCLDIIRGLNDIIKFETAQTYLFNNIFNEEALEIKFLQLIKDEWIQIRTLLAKGFYAKKYKKEKLDKVIDKLKLIIEYDKKLVDSLLCNSNQD